MFTRVKNQKHCCFNMQHNTLSEVGLNVETGTKHSCHCVAAMKSCFLYCVQPWCMCKLS